MSVAILAHTEAQGTDGGALGSTLNTWYRRRVNTEIVNESSIVESLTTTPGSEAFALIGGTYRMEAEMSFYLLYSFSASADTGSAVAVLYDDTDDVVVAAFSPTYQGDQASSLALTGNGAATIPFGRMVTLSCLTIFDVSASSKTYSFRAAGAGSETWVANTNACGIDNAQTNVLGGAQVGNRYLTAKFIRKNS